MFVVTEADAATIRAAFEQHGEFAAAVELRRLFPGVTDNAQARECARTNRRLEAAAGEASRRSWPPGSDQTVPEGRIGCDSTGDVLARVFVTVTAAPCWRM